MVLDILVKSSGFITVSILLCLVSTNTAIYQNHSNTFTAYRVPHYRISCSTLQHIVFHITVNHAPHYSISCSTFPYIMFYITAYCVPHYSISCYILQYFVFHNTAYCVPRYSIPCYTLQCIMFHIPIQLISSVCNC
jgi:hypothetical protein